MQLLSTTFLLVYHGTSHFSSAPMSLSRWVPAHASRSSGHRDLHQGDTKPTDTLWANDSIMCLVYFCSWMCFAKNAHIYIYTYRYRDIDMYISSSMYNIYIYIFTYKKMYILNHLPVYVFVRNPWMFNGKRHLSSVSEFIGTYLQMM